MPGKIAHWKKLNFLSKIPILTKLPIIGKNPFLVKMAILDQNFDFWLKSRCFLN